MSLWTFPQNGSSMLITICTHVPRVRKINEVTIPTILGRDITILTLPKMSPNNDLISFCVRLWPLS